jgi:hypothetical protein
VDDEVQMVQVQAIYRDRTDAKITYDIACCDIRCCYVATIYDCQVMFEAYAAYRPEILTKMLS